MNELLQAIEQIDQSVTESEISVMESLIAVYDKALTVMVFQEGDIMNQAKGKSDESMIKRIFMFIPRLIKAIIKAIGKVLGNVITIITRKLSGKNKDQLITLDFNPLFVEQYVGEMVYHLMQIEYNVWGDLNDPNQFVRCVISTMNKPDKNHGESMEAFDKMTKMFPEFAYKKATLSREEFEQYIEKIRRLMKEIKEYETFIAEAFSKVTDVELLKDTAVLEYYRRLSDFYNTMTGFDSVILKQEKEIWKAQEDTTKNESDQLTNRDILNPVRVSI